MKLLKNLFKDKKKYHAGSTANAFDDQAENSVGKTSKFEDFIESCLEPPYVERADVRNVSHFKELSLIDAAWEAGDLHKAVELCREGILAYPDSFLFYNRAADLYDELAEKLLAEKCLLGGLHRCLSVSAICGKLAERALKEDRYRDATSWWIRAGVVQLKTKNLVDIKPFLNLAYVCQPLGQKSIEEWLLRLADRVSSSGAVRLDTAEAQLRHKVAIGIMFSCDNAALQVIQAYYKRYA